MDETEVIRRVMLSEINSQVESNDEDTERERLESLHGKVWNTQELQEEFEVEGFLAPFVSVKEKKTGDKGMMEFQHRPRFYFNFKKEA